MQLYHTLIMCKIEHDTHGACVIHNRRVSKYSALHFSFGVVFCRFGFSYSSIIFVFITCFAFCRQSNVSIILLGMCVCECLDWNGQCIDCMTNLYNEMHQFRPTQRSHCITVVSYIKCIIVRANFMTLVNIARILSYSITRLK